MYENLIFQSCRSASFSGLGIYHFPTAGGNARLRVSRETKKNTL